MSDAEEKKRKKLPKSIVAIGTFQTAAGLFAITLMAISGEWNLWITVLAIGYTALGAGLLAVMEWARFVSVVVHPMALVWLMFVASRGGAGLLTTIQVIIALGILYQLTRPHIRSFFQQASKLAH